MRKIITASALGLVMATPVAAFAQQGGNAELDALKQQVQALMQKVQELEAKQAADAARTEARVAEAEATNDNKTDQIAKASAKLTSSDWATKVKMKGDIRYRHEMIDQENSAERTRQRLRVRVGVDAKVNDTVTAGLQLATGDDADPRSTNATLGDYNTRKSIRLDQAYLNWNAFQNGVVTLGKQSQPWVKAGNSMFYDGDVNPEGVAIKYGAKEGLFLNGWAFWLSEVSAGADANLFGAQVGYRFPFGLTAYATYNDTGAVKDSAVFAWSDNPAGNTTANRGSSCAPGTTGTTKCYVYDYSMVELGLQYNFKVGEFPVMVFGNYAENSDPSDLSSAYSIGFLAGKADPGKFEFGALYQEVEKDALFGALTDSDFAGGSTQGNGAQLRVAYGLAKNWTFNGQYFINTRNFDTASELDYNRLQLDLNYKF